MLAWEYRVNCKECNLGMHFRELGFDASFLTMEHHWNQPTDGSLGQVRCVHSHAVKLIDALLSSSYLFFVANQADLSGEIRDLKERVVGLNSRSDVPLDSDLTRVNQLLDFFDVHENKLLLFLGHVQCFHLKRVQFLTHLLADLEHVTTSAEDVDRRRLVDWIDKVSDQSLIEVKVYPVLLAVVCQSTALVADHSFNQILANVEFDYQKWKDILPLLKGL